MVSPNNASKWQMGFKSAFKGLKYSVLTVVKKIHKMQHLEGSGTPVLYIGRTVLKRLMQLFYFILCDNIKQLC